MKKGLLINNILKAKLIVNHSKYIFQSNYKINSNSFLNYINHPFSTKTSTNIKEEKIDYVRKLNSLYRFQENSSKIKKEKNKEKDNEEKIEKEEDKPSIVSRFTKGFAKIWNDTFPKEVDYRDQISKKMEEARILKEKIFYPQEEEIKALQEKVAEWKRFAVVLVMDEVIEKKESLLSTYTKNINNMIKQTKTYDAVKKSDTYNEYLQFREDLDVIKSNIKDNISLSYNPAVILAKDLVDKVSTKSVSSEAIKLIRKKIPTFDFYEFEQEVRFIFKSVIEAFKKDDTKYLELSTSETALGMSCGIIKQRKERKLQMKYKELLYLDEAKYHNAVIDNEDSVRLQFMMNAQENNCLVDKEGKIQDGEENTIESCYYVVEIMINPEPKEDLLGHPWVITKVERTGVIQQLI